jgi:integrase
VRREHYTSFRKKCLVFKVILLGLGAGLRRSEIDTLMWDQIDWERRVISIETTEHTGTKSAESENEVDVDPELLEILKGYRNASNGSPFVIVSPNQPRPLQSRRYYRAESVLKRTTEWLHSQGIKARTPLHSLRKEMGSVICAEQGIYAASLALRHSNIAITRDYYIDKKKAVSFPIGKMLKASAGH